MTSDWILGGRFLSAVLAGVLIVSPSVVAQETGRGAGTGAGLGALAGLVFGDDLGDVLEGAIVSAAGGAIVGSSQENARKDREQRDFARRQTSWSSSEVTEI